MATATKSRSRKPRLSEEEREQRTQELKAELHAAVLALNTDAKWEEFLVSVSEFAAGYSWGNQLLLLTQAQRRGIDLTMVLPFGARDKSSGWLKLGRCVRKGEKGLKIWRPVFSALRPEEIEQRKAKGQPTHQPNGKPLRVLRTFTIESVFDISQTDGDPVEVPEPTVRKVRRLVGGKVARAELLTGEDTTGALAPLIAVIQGMGWSFERVPASRLDGANGHADPSTRTVRVREDVSDAQTVKTTCHELAHVLLDHVGDMAEYRQHRGRMETEAESVAFVVLGTLGLDSVKYSAPYVSGWSEGDAKVLEQTAEVVVRTARDILKRLESLLPAEDDETGTEVPEPAQTLAMTS